MATANKDELQDVYLTTLLEHLGIDASQVSTGMVELEVDVTEDRATVTWQGALTVPVELVNEAMYLADQAIRAAVDKRAKSE